MGAMGEQKRAENTWIIETHGRTTTLNGETVKGIWQNAGIIAIQRFLADTEWAKSAYEVRLPAYVYDPPYSIANGMEITRSGLNYRCLVRDVTPEDEDDVVIQCNALVVSTVE